MPGMSNRRLSIIMLFTAAVVIAAAFQWDVPLETTQSGRTASAATGPLQVTAGADANRLECPMAGPCRPLNVWFVFQNRSAQTIADVRIADFQAPGFAFEAGDPDLAGLFAQRSVKSQASDTVTAKLKPAAGSGRYNITAVYAWTNPAGGELRGSISLGPVEISSWWRRPIFNAARRIKDLALPLALAIAGWFLQNEQKKRDDLQVVLTTLLPAHVIDTKKYYLPFVSRTSVLIERIELVTIAQKEGASAADLRTHELRCVHAFFAMMKQHRFVIRGIGGVQFKNHLGEKIMGRATRFFMTEAIEYRIGQDTLDRCLATMTLHQNFGEFVDALNRGPFFTPAALTSGTELVRKWIQDPGEPLRKMIPVLTILREVLLYEMDAPMELWYREPREFPLAELAKARTELESLTRRDAGDTVTRKPGVEAKLQGVLKQLMTRVDAYASGRVTQSRNARLSQMWLTAKQKFEKSNGTDGSAGGGGPRRA